MAVARKDWIDRALAGAASDADMLGVARALASVKPVAPTYYPPLTGPAEVVRVDFEPILADAPTEEWRDNPDPAYIGEDAEYGNEGNDMAALRQQLAQAVEYGDRSQVRALVMLDGLPRLLVLDGTEAAIRQALPDAETVKAWREAGVSEFPVQLAPGSGAVRRVTWVPIDKAPRVLQVERASREAVADA